MRKLKAVVIFGLCLLGSCGHPSVSPREAVFATQVPFRLLPGLHLEDPQVKKYGDGYYSIVMGLENESGDYIWFPNSRYGTASLIYLESEGKWVELKDRAIYLSDSEEVLAPKSKGEWWFTIVSVDPILPPDIQPPVTVRVVVIGRIYRDGKPTDEEVGTYLDVTLPP